MPPHHAAQGEQLHHAPSHGPSRGTRLHTLASDDGKHLPEDTIPGDRIPCTGRDATASPKKAGDTSRSIPLHWTGIPAYIYKPTMVQGAHALKTAGRPDAPDRA